MRKRITIEKINTLPRVPGVYFLKNKQGKIFYIGKSNNLRSRVGTHARDANFKLSEEIAFVEWIQTANEMEALIKESEYIKHHQPKLNSRLRDDKQYFYIGVTREDLPRLFITHQTLIASGKSLKTKPFAIAYIGPFTDGASLKVTMKYLRKLFPYYQANSKTPLRTQKHRAIPCSWCHIGQCPGVNPNKRLYKKNISAIKSILTGKKTGLIKKMRSDMKVLAKNKNFEDAAHKRDLIEAIENIFSHHNIVIPWSHSVGKQKDAKKGSNDIYLSKLLGSDLPIKNIEGYDISNIQGKNPTASMVRFENGKPNKSLYRKFNITSPDEPNDYLMMAEVIERRFKHTEWPYPDLILIDGGKGQLNAAKRSLKRSGVILPIASLAKRLEELYIPGRQKTVLLETMPPDTENLLKHIRDESHRFALSHHRRRHRANFKK